MHIGRYTIIEELGAGGMGRVRLARCPEGRLVVLKTALVPDKDDDERLRDEARVGLRLSHPNIVETVDCFEHEGRPVLATRYVAGAAVIELRQHGPLSPLAVVRIGRHIADALDAIHECTDEAGRRLGVLHRDVTAGNVLVDDAGAARLIDLGIARSRESRAMRTETGMLRGTLRYLAPELFDSGSQSAQSDLWALGIVLWEALLGRSAVVGSDVVAMGRICSGNVMALEPGEAPDARVHKAIAQLLQRRPGDRPRRARDAAALFAMLQRELGDDGRHDTCSAVHRVLQHRQGKTSRAACGLMQDAPLSAPPVPPTTSTVTPTMARPTMAATVPGVPIKPHAAAGLGIGDPRSMMPSTPSQGLLDYAARLTSMENSLSLAWGESEQRNHEALRGLPVITGHPVEDIIDGADYEDTDEHAAAAGNDDPLAGIDDPTARWWARGQLPTIALPPGSQGDVPFGSHPVSRIETPAIKGVAGVGRTAVMGAPFARAMAMPPHTPVHMPAAFMRGALDAVDAHPPVAPSETGDVTAPTGASLSLLPPHVVQASAFAAELAAARRRIAALTVLVVVMGLGLVVILIVGRLG